MNVPGFTRSFTKRALFVLPFCTKRCWKKTGFIVTERKFIGGYLRCVLVWIYYLKILVNIIKVVCTPHLVAKVCSIWTIFHLVLPPSGDRGAANASDSWLGEQEGCHLQLHFERHWRRQCHSGSYLKKPSGGYESFSWRREKSLDLTLWRRSKLSNVASLLSSPPAQTHGLMLLTLEVSLAQAAWGL